MAAIDTYDSRQPLSHYVMANSSTTTTTISLDTSRYVGGLAKRALAYAYILCNLIHELAYT